MSGRGDVVHCICPRWREEDGGSDDADGSCASRGIILLGAPALVPRPLYQRRPTVSAGPMLEKVVIPLQLFLPLPFNSVSTREKLVTMRMPPSRLAFTICIGHPARDQDKMARLLEKKNSRASRDDWRTSKALTPTTFLFRRVDSLTSIHPPPHHQSCHGRANDKSFDWGVVGD